MSTDSPPTGAGTPPPRSNLPPIGLGTGLWISPAGSVTPLSGSHIDEIIAWPEKFGTRRTHLLRIHERFGERLHTEGQARHWVIRAVLSTGWIRLRHQRNFWSVSVDDLELRRPTLQAFFHALHRQGAIGIHGEIRIYCVRQESLNTLDVRDLLAGFDPANGPALQPGRTQDAEDLAASRVHVDFGVGSEGAPEA